MKKFSILNIAVILIYVVIASCSSQAKFASGSKKSYDSKSSQVFNFTSSLIVNGNLKISDGGRYTSFDIIQSEKQPSQVIKQQLTRRTLNEVYDQGHAARTSSEEFKLSEAGMLDFLVVIDDSKSMDDEQKLIAPGLASLIADFKDTNWQIAVISMSDPCVKAANLIKKSDVNAAAKFAAAVQKPFDPLATEQGFPMAMQALKGQCNGALRPWIRPGSSVGVLFLSDEDNCGSNPREQDRCINLPGKNAAEIVNYLHSIRTAEEARIYALTDSDGTCPDAGGRGYMYAEAAQLMGGSSASICHDFTTANGYGAYLSSVSTSVSRILKKQFVLTSRPDMTQFDAVVDGKPLAQSSILGIDGRVVKIDPLLVKDGLKISFIYTHDAIPMLNEVPAQPAPNLSTLVVTVNGAALVQNVDFRYDPIKRVIAFSPQPPEDSKVVVKYIEAKALNTHFATNFTGVRPDTIKVTVNGIPASQQDYSYEATGINFITAPTDGAIIATSWKTNEHKILSYPASSTDPRHPTAWTVKDQKSGTDVAADWKNPTIHFEPENVVENRIVTVTLDFGSKSNVRTVDLPDDRIDDDVKVTADGKSNVCEVKPAPVALDMNDAEGKALLAETTPATADKPADKEADKEADKAADKANNSDWKARYKGKDLSFQCVAGNDFTELSIDYKHEVQRVNKFVVPLPQAVDPNDKDLGWKVFLNGKPTTEFKRSGLEIELEDSLLPPQTKVDVEVITYN